MKLMIRLMLVFVFQFNALNALAGMLELPQYTGDYGSISESQQSAPGSHCDVSESAIDHCHCAICFVVVDSEEPNKISGRSQQFFALTINANQPYFGIYKPPQ